MLCNCFAYQHLLTPVVPAVCFYCGDRLMSYSRLSDLRTPGYYFPSYLPAFLLPRRKLITVSNTQILKNLILPDVCSNLPVSCFLRSHRFNFECFNQLRVSSQKPVRLPRQTHFSYLPPAVIVLWGLPKHTEEECINFITAAQNRWKLSTADQMLLFCCLCNHRSAAGGVAHRCTYGGFDHSQQRQPKQLVVKKWPEEDSSRAPALFYKQFDDLSRTNSVTLLLIQAVMKNLCAPSLFPA